MSRLPERHRKDSNANELVGLWLELGGQWSWGPPFDGWAAMRDYWHPVEIKDPRRKGKKDEYTENQVRFMNKCLAMGNHFWTWREKEDVLQSVRLK